MRQQSYPNICNFYPFSSKDCLNTFEFGFNCKKYRFMDSLQTYLPITIQNIYIIKRKKFDKGSKRS
jgi:hypothetical protein